jgi:hypothetical protein
VSSTVALHIRCVDSELVRKAALHTVPLTIVSSFSIPTGTMCIAKIQYQHSRPIDRTGNHSYPTRWFESSNQPFQGTRNPLNYPAPWSNVRIFYQKLEPMHAGNPVCGISIIDFHVYTCTRRLRECPVVANISHVRYATLSHYHWSSVGEAGGKCVVGGRPIGGL